MKPLIRKISKNGALTIPAIYRNAIGLSTGGEVSVIMHKNMIVIRKHKDCCVFCGSDRKLTVLNGVASCRTCTLKLMN